MRRAVFNLLAMFLAMFLALVLPLAALAAEVKIGVAVPLTGLYGQDGQQIRDAYTFWAEEVNAQGGLKLPGGPYPVKLIFYDDQSDPQTSARLVEKLVNKDKVDLLLGGFGSSQVMAASAVSERHGYPLVCGAASSNELFERGYKYYFSTLGRATDEVRGAVEVFQNVSPRPQTVAIVGANIPFTAQACEGFRKFAQEAGLRVVHYELFPVTLQDYDTVLEKAKAKHPDLLLVGSHLGVALRVVKAMKEINFAPQGVAFSYGPTVAAFVAGLGRDAEYVFAASEWTPNLPYEGPLLGTAREFNQAYQTRWGRQPDYVEAAAVAGALAQQVAAEMLALKPPFTKEDRRRLMEQMHSLDLMTFYGQINFGADGANLAHPPVAVQVQGGRLVNVYPAYAAEAPPRYPMPAWNKR